MRLTLECLEAREVPALLTGPSDLPLIEGWTGPYSEVFLDLNNDDSVERVVIAGDGGSAHVVAYHGGETNVPLVPSGTPGVLKPPRLGEKIVNFIAFEDTFRGGAIGTAIIVPDGPDILALVPGVGGGPVVALYTLGEGGELVQINRFMVFDDPNYRGGLNAHQISYAPEVPAGPRTANSHLLILPREGGGPRAVTFDRDGVEVADFLVGPEDDRREVRVIGAGVDLPGRPGHQAIYIQDADGVVRAYDWTGTEYPISDDDFGPRAAVV